MAAAAVSQAWEGPAGRVALEHGRVWGGWSQGERAGGAGERGPDGAVGGGASTRGGWAGAGLG